jgi:hypothetical protein
MGNVWIGARMNFRYKEMKRFDALVIIFSWSLWKQINAKVLSKHSLALQLNGSSQENHGQI